MRHRAATLLVITGLATRPSIVLGQDLAVRDADPVGEVPHVVGRAAQPATGRMPQRPVGRHRSVARRPRPHPARRPAGAKRSAAHRGRRSVPAVAPMPEAMALPSATGDGGVAATEFFIGTLRIPPFLLPVYRAAERRYGVPWEILAAINEIETNYGHNRNTSSAGAAGWMQFLPSTFQAYGVDANGDGRRDPDNPVDAIFSAANYLEASGAGQDLGRALFAYNHAQWYVDSVLARARLIAGVPADLREALGELLGARFPVRDVATDQAGTMVPTPGAGRSADVLAAAGSRVVAVTDGRIVARGRTHALGRFLRLRDVNGHTFTYADLAGPVRGGAPRSAVVTTPRTFAYPVRPWARAEGEGRMIHHRPRADGGIRPSAGLRVGATVAAGTTLGTVAGPAGPGLPHIRFMIRPAGSTVSLADPVPILASWRLLEDAGVYGDAIGGRAGSTASALLAGRRALAEAVLRDPGIVIPACGRREIRAGRIDRRVLGTLTFLSRSGLDPEVSVLRCGHRRLTTAGNVSEHASGDAVDITGINGVPVLGNQGPGSITETAIRSLISLPGTMQPHQIISLMAFDGIANTLALPDHADHIHVGFSPSAGERTAGARTGPTGNGDATRLWDALLSRLREIGNPQVTRVDKRTPLGP